MSDGENPNEYPLKDNRDLDEGAQTSPDPLSLDGLQVLPNVDDGPAELPPRKEAEWYVADAFGNRQGPFNLEVLRRRAALGELESETLLWRQGLTQWMPAGSITDVASFLGCDGPAAPPPPPKLRKSVVSAVSAALSQVFSDQVVIRTVGRLSLVTSVLVLLVSLGLWYWGYTWFTGSLVLFAVWINCETAGAIQEAIAELKR